MCLSLPVGAEKEREKAEEEEGGGSFVWPKGGDWEQAFRRLSQLDVLRSACVRSGEAQRVVTTSTGLDVISKQQKVSRFRCQRFVRVIFLGGFSVNLVQNRVCA